jgi:hypothetical protein
MLSNTILTREPLRLNRIVSEIKKKYIVFVPPSPGKLHKRFLKTTHDCDFKDVVLLVSSRCLATSRRVMDLIQIHPPGDNLMKLF